MGHDFLSRDYGLRFKIVFEGEGFDKFLDSGAELPEVAVVV